MEQKELFTQLYKLDVNNKTEKKNGLTYLSWAWAWAEFKKACPDATYEIVKQENGLPYAYDPNTGYMVYTRVTAAGVTHEMWLPVMDSANHAMKAEPYEVQTKYKVVEVEPATMFDINKTIMRCLTKCLAMFGLGLYIYAGEDLPDDETKQPTRTPEKAAVPPETIKCAVCGEEIKPAKKGAQTLLPADIARKTDGKCLKCYKAAQQKDGGDGIGATA